MTDDIATAWREFCRTYPSPPAAAWLQHDTAAMFWQLIETGEATPDQLLNSTRNYRQRKEWTGSDRILRPDRFLARWHEYYEEERPPWA